MADLESSWQESVIKLAQTGNLRAIAFWLNRYLVPQGICAQVTHEQPGSLLIRVVCHRPPERERLVRFICHRLCKLNAAGIQEARITAQIIGSPTLLWEKSARIAAPVQASRLASAPMQPSPAIARRQPPTRKSVRQGQMAKSENSFSLLKLIPTQLISRLHRTTQLTLHQTVRQLETVGQSPVAVAQLPDMFLYSNASGNGSSSANLSRQGSNSLTLHRPIKRQIRRFLRWFLAFPPHVRILLLAGSIAAAFLVGSALHALRNLQSTKALQSSEPATFGSRKFSLGASNTVWTALENVPVIQQPVVNPQDPAVTLLFANSATLGRVSQGGAHRLADVVITSLDKLPPATTPIATPVPLATNSPTADALPPDSVTAEPAETKEISPDNAPQNPDAVEASPIPEITIPDLSANGVDIVNLASNGLMAGGVPELAQAKDLLRKNAVYAIGAGQNPNETRRPVVMDVKGQRIAYLGYSDKIQNSTDGNPVDKNSAGVNSALEAQITQDIRAIRAQVDWVVVTYQWSEDPKSYPEDWQVKLAHLAVDQGADLVVGNRPGVTQGGEVYQGKAIAYSLGSSMSELDKAGESPALKVTLQDKTMKLEILPLQLGQPMADSTDMQQKFKQSSSLFDQPLESPLLLDGQIHLPAAPQSSIPDTDPFISYPTDKALPKP
jgi:Bacterial capsule synthesis protein PGA_cap